MKLELKNIKHTAWASQETYCYQASLYVDGKPVAVVSNEGHGGPDMDYAHPKFKGDFRDKMNQVHAYFKTLPKIPSQWNVEGYSQDLDGWCGDQIEEWLDARELKGKLRTHILYQKEGEVGIYAGKGQRSPHRMTDGTWTNQGQRFLNDMPFADALVIWKDSVA